MVFIITGAAESDRNTVGRFLAEALGWEYADAENLHPPAHLEARRCGTALANADPVWRLETLSAAINFWIYGWRDVVVSCPVLTERERRQLSKVSSLVKIVCLEVSHATGRALPLDQSVRAASSESSSGRHAAREAGQDVITVDSSRQLEEIIKEITALLIMRKSKGFARA
jgi:gluconokinase